MNAVNSFTTVRQNRVSKQRNAIGLYRAGRSISLNQLNTDYVEQLYKEQYLVLREQHEQTKRQFNKQQDQLKQLNSRLQRLLQEKRDFLGQFVQYGQLNAGCLVEDLEMTNLRLEKENRRLKDQLLLAQVQAASGLKSQLNGNVMIINMKQQLHNYGWVKARIDSGLSDSTRRNPLSGQLVRQRRMAFNGSVLGIRRHSNGGSSIDRRRTASRSALTNRSINGHSTAKLANNRPTINKERHRVSFSNQLEQEHLYEDDFEQEDEEEAEDWTLDSSDDDEEESKLSEAERQPKNNGIKKLELAKPDPDSSSSRTAIDAAERPIDNDTTAVHESSESPSSEDEANPKQVKKQLNKAKGKIKKLEEIVYLQQQYIDRQQELANQNDQLDSLREENSDWFASREVGAKSGLLMQRERASGFEAFQRPISPSSNSSTPDQSASSPAGRRAFESKQPAGDKTNERQIEFERSSGSIKQGRLMATNYPKNKTRKSGVASNGGTIDRLSGEESAVSGKKTPESTKSSAFGDDETISSSSLSSLDQLTLSVLVKHEKEERILISNGDKPSDFLNDRTILDRTTMRSAGKHGSSTGQLLENLSMQLQVEKARSEQAETRNRGRIRELEENVSELSKENEILRSSLEKCIQDCLSEIGGSGLS